MIDEMKRPERLDEDRIEAIKALFPEAFPDGKFDAQTLKELLESPAEPPVEGGEFYGLNWPGKRQARKLAVKPSEGTLAPVPGLGVSEDTTGNVIIEGDNLEVMRTILKAYAGRVKLIYIDPPYNTGRDFVYSDDYSEPLETYLRRTDQQDDMGLLTSNPKSGGRYHSKWLDMMYPRLKLAHELLSPEGAIFVSLDDNEIFNLRHLMDEIFGAENFITTVIWQKVYAPKNSAKHFSEDHDYIAIYAKDGDYWRPRLMPRSDEANARYINPDNDPRGPWKPGDTTARNYYADGLYEVESPSGKKFTPARGNYWRYSFSRFKQLDQDKRIWWGQEGGNMPSVKRFLSEVRQGIVPQTLWKYEDVGHTQDAKRELIEFVGFENTDNVIDSVKPTKLLQRILHLVTDSNTNDIVLDFFSGTGSTGHAVMKQNHEDKGNRKFILVQLPVELDTPETKLKTIADVTMERIRNVGAALSSEKTQADVGFRLFRTSRSNLTKWQTKTARSVAELQGFDFTGAGALVPDYKTRDVLTELMLLEGFPLDSRVEQSPEFDDEVHVVTHPERSFRLLVCLSTDTLSDATVQATAKYPKDTFVCLESSLNDQLKLRLADAVENVKTL
ncbi:site-specific DNA-methyltransferase [Deinococcus sp.]|uniref:site-specific DNA-methyltransferase n=1 Tax=Deinococcus sp. TaxID=47478 RepID=UPI0025C1ED3A|nr:site-specific DNA-methyltransferase [Deinococcus sp.]